ncbi:MAG: AMP-binding protein [Pseudomonadota bacterium]
MDQVVTKAVTDADLGTLPRRLREHARTIGDKVALRQKEHGVWKEYTWRDYERMASHFAQGLAKRGYKRGEHIAILSENRKEWLIGELGIQILGAAVAGIYPTSPAAEVKHALASSDAVAVICEDQEQVDKVLEIIDELPMIREIIAIAPKGLRTYDHPKLIYWDDVMADGAEADDPSFYDKALADHHPDDTALIVFTSGSTGLPKAAMISFRNIAAVGEVTAAVTPSSPDDRVISYLPLCHVAEQLFSVFLAFKGGYQVNFGESLRTIQEDLREVAPTIFLGVPRIWERMQSQMTLAMADAGPIQKMFLKPAMEFAKANPDRTNRPSGPTAQFYEWLIFRPLRNMMGLTRCHSAVSGAAPIAPETLAFFRGVGVPLLEGFGMTETAGTSCAQQHGRPSVGRVGHPLPGVEMKLADDGELLVKGDIVFKGYYKRPDATEEAIVDGWLHTGDVAEFHDDGSISIIDRKKDIMITAGGKNLTPSMIENRMKASPFIKECVVVADQRKFPSALVQLDWDTVSKWAEAKNIAYTTFRSLAENDAVRELIWKEVEKGNSDLANVEQIKKIHMLTKELDHDDGEVTATMKVRRASIYKSYADEIEALYR